MASRARRIGLVAAALAVTAGVAGLFVASRRKDASTPGGGRAPVAAADAGPARGPGPLIRPAIVRAAPGRDAGAEAEPPAVPEEVRGARAQLERVARPCFDAARAKDPAIFPLIRFRYTLVIERGQARASDIRLEREDIAGDELPACLLAAMGAARWPAQAPDGRLQIADGFAFEGSLDEAPTP